MKYLTTSSDFLIVLILRIPSVTNYSNSLWTSLGKRINLLWGSDNYGMRGSCYLETQGPPRLSLHVSQCVGFIISDQLASHCRAYGCQPSRIGIPPFCCSERNLIHSSWVICSTKISHDNWSLMCLIAFSLLLSKTSIAYLANKWMKTDILKAVHSNWLLFWHHFPLLNSLSINNTILLIVSWALGLEIYLFVPNWIRF